MNAAQGGPWTRHGHEIAGVTVAGGRPPAVARCGGPALCRQCREDVATALGEKPAAPDRPTREQAAEALHYAAGLSDRDVDDTPRESYMSDTIRVLAVEVRALCAELDRAVAAHALCDSNARSLIDWCDGNFEPDELFNPPSAAAFTELMGALRAALVARTPQPAEHAGAEAAGVLWMALRYAMGRQTYAVQEVGDAIAQHAHRLAPGQRERMAQEIERELGYDADGAAWGCDGETWRRAISDLRAPLPAVPDGPTPDAYAAASRALDVWHTRRHEALRLLRALWAAGDVSVEPIIGVLDAPIPPVPAVPDGEDETAPPRRVKADAWGPIPELPLADPNDTGHGYVVARVLDGTGLHGDRVLELWDDDMHRAESPAVVHHLAEQVDDDGGWCVYEVRRLDAPDGEDVPARLDAAAEALDKVNRGGGPSLRNVAIMLRKVHPDVRAAVAAAALARPTERER